MRFIHQWGGKKTASLLAKNFSEKFENAIEKADKSKIFNQISSINLWD